MVFMTYIPGSSGWNFCTISKQKTDVWDNGVYQSADVEG